MSNPVTVQITCRLPPRADPEPLTRSGVPQHVRPRVARVTRDGSACPRQPPQDEPGRIFGVATVLIGAAFRTGHVIRNGDTFVLAGPTCTGVLTSVALGHGRRLLDQSYLFHRQ
jgi:hypothetical protein